jgi:hypothetical protein
MIRALPTVNTAGGEFSRAEQLVDLASHAVGLGELVQLAAPQTGARLGLPAREVPANARGERVAHRVIEVLNWKRAQRASPRPGAAVGRRVEIQGEANQLGVSGSLPGEELLEDGFRRCEGRERAQET